jgi:hypothetical protein
MFLYSYGTEKGRVAIALLGVGACSSNAYPSHGSMKPRDLTKRMLCRVGGDVNAGWVREITVCKPLLRKCNGLLGVFLGTVRPDRTCNQRQPAHQQNQHHHGVEQTGRPKVDVHVGEDTCKDEQRSRRR